jgi:hypothetical protein
MPSGAAIEEAKAVPEEEVITTATPDAIVSPSPKKDVVAVITGQRVTEPRADYIHVLQNIITFSGCSTGNEIDRHRARGAVEKHVGLTGVAVKHVIATASVHRINRRGAGAIPSTRIDEIIARAARGAVASSAGVDDVVTMAPTDQVDASSSPDGVIAALAGDHISAGGSHQDIVAGGTDDRRGHSETASSRGMGGDSRDSQ